MIAIIDYDVGNLRSVQKGFEAVGVASEIVRKPEQVAKAEKVVLPGVGAFCDAVASLRSHEMEQAVREHIRSGRPFLGVCLGMQMLFERSYEDGCHVGLGILPGEVVRFQNDANGLKVPHMGWNQLWFENEKPILAGIRPGDYVYYVHSYHVAPKDRAVIAAETDYGGWFCSVLSTGNIHATQFHPEKSQKVGLTILRNFARM